MDCDQLQGGYYATIPRPVLDDAALRWPAMVLYAHLTSYARKTGFCYAKNATLIREMTRVNPYTGAENTITERTLQSLLAELRDRGHIHMDTGPLPPDQDGVVRQGRRIFIGTCLADPPGGEKIFTPENIFAEGVKKISPPIKCKNNINKTKNPLPPVEVWDAIHAYIGDDPDYREAFEGFLTNRNAMHKPIKTVRAISRIINHLRAVNCREVEIAMLDKAVVNNWLDVYPLKPDELAAVKQAAQEARTGGGYGWE